MRIPAEHKLQSEWATEKWENWIYLLELKCDWTLEAARIEYAAIRDALQTKGMDEIRSGEHGNNLE